MFPAGVGRKSLVEAYDSHRHAETISDHLPLARSDRDHGASAVLLVARCGTAGGKASKGPVPLPQAASCLFLIPQENS